MQKRVQIRNRVSEKEIKPRVFDALVEEDGKILLYIKNRKVNEIIPLEDVLLQIEEAMGN